MSIDLLEKELEDILNDGRNIIIFPEGTRDATLLYGTFRV